MNKPNTPTPSRRSSTWTVAVDHSNSPNSVDRGTKVCTCLNELGISANLAEDGDPSGLKADVMLFMENPADFFHYPRQLPDMGTQRPLTVTWMLETLPPCGLSSRTEQMGLKAAEWKRRLGLWNGDTNQRSKLRRSIYRSLSSLLQRRVLAGMHRELPNLGGDQWKQVRGAFENWHFLRQALQTGWLDRCIVSTQQRQKFLAEHGWHAPFVPVGWHEGLGNITNIERDIDVLFLGHLRRDRRRSRLKWLNRQLCERGISLQLVTAGCYGDERTRLLNRTRILVMLHQYSWSPAWIRFVLGAASGACIVSEYGLDKEPFQDGTHYLGCTLEDMPQLIADLLANEPRRAQIAKTAYRHCTQKVTLTSSVRAIVEAVTKHQAHEL